MRNALLLSPVLVVVVAVIASENGVAAQNQPAPAKSTPTQQPAPAPKPPQPTTQAPAPKPSTPAPTGQTPAAPAAPRRPAASTTTAGRGGMAITITDASGGTLAGVTVSMEGPTPRSGESNASGQINFPGLLAGTYRVRFEGDAVVPFEKEVTVRGGQVAPVDVVLTAAKKTPAAPAPAPPPPSTPASAKTGPVGQPQFLSIPKVLEGDFVGKNPRRESLLSCSGSTRATMIQINMPLPERMYAESDIVYYVIAGEGSMKLNGKEQRLAVNDFVSVPRGGSHSFERRGN